MTYSATVLADSPIRYYKLNESSGTTATDSGSQASNGVYEGSYTQGQTSLLLSDSSTCTRFNSSPSQSDIFMSASGLPLGFSSWSQEAWFKCSTLPGNGVAYAICGWGTDNAGQRAYLLVEGTTGNAHIVLTTLDAGTAVTTSNSIAVNTAYHIVATYDGSTTTVYINGVSAGTGSGTLTIVATYAGIARETTDNLHADNTFIQHVAFYSTCLTSTQVLAHYEAADTTRTISCTTPLLSTKTRSLPCAVSLIAPLTLYGTQTAATTLVNACTLVTGTGGTTSNKNTLIGLLTGYGQVYSKGNASAWAALGSIGSPDGHGWLFGITTLEGQRLVAGNWVPTFRFNLSVGSIVCDLYVRAYVYDSSGAYTQIGSSMVLSAQTINTTLTTYTFGTTSLPVQNMVLGQKLYFDVWPNITANSTTSSAATLKIQGSISATQGNVLCQLVTPGYQLGTFRTLTTTTPLLLTKTRTLSCTVALSIVTTGYTWKKSLTIDHTKVSGSANLASFPVLISHTDTALKVTGSGGHVTSSSGFDIIFTNSAGTLKYNHELVSYVSTTGQIIAWVQVPSVSFTADTVFSVFYGNAAITTTQEAITATWDTNYLGVYHLDNNPAGTAPQMIDSTTHQSGTSVNMVSGDLVTGQIFKGTNFNGTTKSINVGTTNSVKNSSQVTISAWLNITALNTAAKHDLYSEAQNSGNTRLNLIVNQSNKIELNGRSTDAGSLTTWATSAATVAATTWYYCVGIYDSVSNTHHLVLNGTDTSASVTVAAFPNTTPSVNTAIGAHCGTASEWVNGIIEELRLSNTARTVGWSITEYNNQLTPSTFYSQGTETAAGTTTPTRTIPCTVALLQTKTRTITATGVLIQTKTRTVTSTVALLATKSRTLSATTPLLATKSRVVLATIPLIATEMRMVACSVALQATSKRTLGTSGVLLQTRTRTVSCTIALLSTKTRAIPTTVTLLATRTRTITSTVPLSGTSGTVRTITAKVALLATKTRGVPCTVALLSTRTRTVSTQTALSLTKARGIPTTIALFSTRTRTVNAHTSLQITRVRVLSCTVALFVSKSRTIGVSVPLAYLHVTRVITVRIALIAPAQRSVPCLVALSAISVSNVTLTVRSGQLTCFVRSGQATISVRG